MTMSSDDINNRDSYQNDQPKKIEGNSFLEEVDKFT